jgi:hypothetical protein
MWWRLEKSSRSSIGDRRGFGLDRSLRLLMAVGQLAGSILPEPGFLDDIFLSGKGISRLGGLVSESARITHYRRACELLGYANPTKLSDLCASVIPIFCGRV